MSGERDLAAVAAEYAAGPERLRARLQKGLLRVALQGEAAAKSNATTAPRVRAGTLRRAIRGRVELQGTVLVALTLSAGEDSPAAAYASVQEKGATIRPRRGRFLAIPLGPALTASGVAKVKSPREVADLRFQPLRGGAMGMLVKDHKGRRARSELWFLLVRSVTVPATRFLGRAMDTIRPAAEATAHTVLQETLGGSDGD